MSTSYVVTRRVGFTTDAVTVNPIHVYDSQLEAERRVNELNTVFQEALSCTLAFEGPDGLVKAPLGLKTFLGGLGITFVAHGIEEIPSGQIVQVKPNILM